MRIQVIQLALLATVSGSILSLEAQAAPAKKAPARPAAAAKQAAPLSSPVYNAYVNQLRPKIDKNWNFPTGNNHVTLSVQMAQDGSVSNLVLTSTPKNGEAEQKASDAFNAAQPFAPLPPGNGATVTVTFDSQSDQWDSKASVGVRMEPGKGTAAAASAGGATAADDKPSEDKATP